MAQIIDSGEMVRMELTHLFPRDFSPQTVIHVGCRNAIRLYSLLTRSFEKYSTKQSSNRETFFFEISTETKVTSFIVRKTSPEIKWISSMN